MHRRFSVALASAFLLALGCSSSTTSGGATDGGGGGSDAGGGTDSGGGGGDGGITDPGGGKTATLTFTSCPAFSACGGSLPGTWDYTAGCVTSDELFASAKQLCASLTTKSISGTAKGTLLFTAATVQRDVTSTVTAVLDIPSSCASLAGGCPGVQAALRQGFPTAACTGTSACDCTITITDTTKDSSAYTQSGNTVTLTNGDKYDVCVAGTKLTYKESGGNASPGVFELTKR
jgi:hypothetical protein